MTIQDHLRPTRKTIMDQSPSLPCRMRVTSALLAIAISLLLAPGSTSPAQAATLWHVDPSGDVEAYDTEYEEATNSKTGWTDIVGVSASYYTSMLKVGTSIRGYRHLDGRWGVSIYTSKGERYVVSSPLNTPPDREDYLRLELRSDGDDIQYIQCDGLGRTRSERGITVTIPTQCIDSPWRIRFGAYNSVSSGGPLNYSDQGFSDGRRSPDGFFLIDYSSWLRQR